MPIGCTDYILYRALATVCQLVQLHHRICNKLNFCCYAQYYVDKSVDQFNIVILSIT